MSNLSQLKKDIEELKAKRETTNIQAGFDILDKYRDGELSYEQCMELLDKEDYAFGDLVRVLLESGEYNDETKRKMIKGVE